MKSNTIIGILSLVILGIVGFMMFQSSSIDTAVKQVSDNGLLATIYKSPTCGCCGQYAEYMEELGYGVDIKTVTEMSSVKEQFGIPYELESCHTTEISGYVVEGHVPEEAIQKLLVEKPDIKGIGMAGMPSGSPGMPGPKTSDFVIYAITHDGERGDVFMTI